MRALQIVGDGARPARVANGRSNVVRARLGPAGEFAQHDATVREMLNHARLDSVQANEAKAAQNPGRRKETRELLFISKPVLQRHDGGLIANQRGKQFGEFLVCRCLQSD